jgi:glycosyltransferase involved in cell wall biosynthesis
MLRTTLGSLINQSYDKKNYEIIVVDNNSSDETRAVVEEWRKRASVEIQYRFEARQGVHYARNSALQCARGEILYYTDDDMVADFNLLAEIVKPFALSSKVATVTGRVLPKWEHTPPDWVLYLCQNGLLSLHERAEDLVIAPYDCGVISCHQALRRDAFAKSGGFNPENTAGEWIGDGETGLNIKLKELGYWFAYIGSAVTYHAIPRERMTQAYLNKRLANQGNCDSYTDYRRNKYTSGQLIVRILTHGFAIGIHSFAFVGKFIMRRGSWRMNQARISYYASRVLYDWRLFSDEAWRELVRQRDWLGED